MEKVVVTVSGKRQHSSLIICFLKQVRLTTFGDTHILSKKLSTERHCVPRKPSLRHIHQEWALKLQLPETESIFILLLRLISCIAPDMSGHRDEENQLLSFHSRKFMANTLSLLESRDAKE